MEIKTIVKGCLAAQEFDTQVNASITEGWHLVKRTILGGGGYLYAELEKPDEVQAEEVEVDPLDAVRFLRNFCKSVPECGPACPLAEWCDPIPDHLAPAHWMVPEKEG